jgi:energy-coupling factor transport system ATP-binding protein
VTQKESPRALDVRGLSFTYRGAARAALRDVDLALPEGRWGLLLGPAGAGKSTLVRCVNRSIPAFFPGELSGGLAVSGLDASQRRPPEMARHVGVVFQDFETQIFSTTCLLEVAFAMENRCLPPDEIGRRAADLLRRVGLGGFEERDPATLSGGEKQRLVIAAVMALEAPLLVLDEPASDLDPEGRAAVYRLIDSIAGESVLLVEHDLEGLPRWGAGTLLREGSVDARWEEGPPSAMVHLADRLSEAGVRPPPLASLVAALRRKAAVGSPPAPPFSPERIEAETLDAALRDAGWRLEASAARPARRVETGPEMLRCEKLEHVYATRGGARRALDGIDLVIRHAEMIAIIGANGSGKTTLARHLCGLEAPTGGRALLRGEEVRAIPASRRAREVGYVFQNPDHQIFAQTVGDEVAFGPKNLGLEPSRVERQVGAALEVVGLSDRTTMDPFTLTKGERQRLALASVLACEPAAVIMDEPTTGLDLKQQIDVMALLARLNASGHTIVIITHALWLVAPPIRRLLVMKEGRVIADGAPGDLLTDRSLMESAAIRMPDLARLARLRGVDLLTLEAWIGALVPPSSAGTS